MISDLQIVHLGFGQWRLTWVSDETDPTFRIYRDGVLVATTKLATHLVRIDDGSFPVFEVLDDDEAEPQRSYSGRAEIAWFTHPDVDSYDVQEWDGAEWITRQTLRRDDRSYLRWSSRVLEDVTSHQFRVVPTGTNGNEGTDIELEIFIVHVPDPPQVTYAYDADDETVTITAA